VDFNTAAAPQQQQQQQQYEQQEEKALEQPRNEEDIGAPPHEQRPEKTNQLLSELYATLRALDRATDHSNNSNDNSNNNSNKPIAAKQEAEDKAAVEQRRRQAVSDEVEACVLQGEHTSFEEAVQNGDDELDEYDYDDDDVAAPKKILVGIDDNKTVQMRRSFGNALEATTPRDTIFLVHVINGEIDTPSFASSSDVLRAHRRSFRNFKKMCAPLLEKCEEKNRHCVPFLRRLPRRAQSVPEFKDSVSESLLQFAREHDINDVYVGQARAARFSVASAIGKRAQQMKEQFGLHVTPHAFRNNGSGTRKKVKTPKSTRDGRKINFHHHH
jgi:hypothetical protein